MYWPLLSSLGDDERRRLLATTQRREFQRGEAVVREGDLADSLHLVSAGRLAVRVTTPRGDTATLKVLSRGDFFGEVSLLDGREARRTASVVALEPAQTHSLSAQAFRDLRADHPEVQALVLSLMARRIEELSDRLVEAMYSSLDERVFRRLLELADIYASDPGQGVHGAQVTIPLTQDHLAELVGAARPSVNVVLQRLVAQQLIALGRGRVTVLDRAALERKAR